MTTAQQLHIVRRKLAVLRAMVEGDMPVKTRWLALRLIDSSCTALGPETPTAERHVCLVIPFPKGPSQMIKHLMLPEPA